MRSAVRHPGRSRVCALVGATVLAGLALSAAPQGARATTSFSAVSSADVVHLSTFVVDAPLAESLVDAGSPSAATALDNVGNSTAQAAAAYPGDTVANNPGTVRGVSPVPLPVPDVPFIASSRFPSPSTSQTTAGPYALSAVSEEQRSTAEATGAALDMAGIALSRASARSLSSTDGTEVLTESSNDASGLDGQGLKIAAVHSLARVAFDGSRTTPTTEFAVSGFSVAGTALEIGPDGVSLAGQKTPLPPSSPLLQILADQGIHVRYLAPTVTPTSVLSAGLQIDKSTDPPAGAPFGTVTQSLVLGRSSAALSNVSSSSSAAVPPAGPAAPAGAPAQAPAGVDGGGADAPVDAVAGGTPGTDPGTGALPAGPGTTADPAVADPAAGVAVGEPAPGPVQQPVLAAGTTGLPRALDLYPPFVIGAVGLLLVSQAARLLGVRQP